jgi:dephospho-CoA kinase
LDSTITVGITGGIGAGKSIVCRILSIMGYPVFYSDSQSREILDNHPAAVQQVTRLFGPDAYQNGKLDRTYIAAQVFQNDELLKKLNEIAHPLVRTAFETWKNQQESPFVFNEAAILFETGSYKNFNFTVLVTAPESLRIQRVLERDHSDEKKVRERMAAQWSDAQKLELANYVIYNDDVQPLMPQLQTMLQKLSS